MTFKEIQGNAPLTKRLTDVIRNQNISHAYIFEGEACLDKKRFVESFVQAILCAEEPGIGCGHCSICNKISHGNHEDLTYVEADGRSIKDEAIEQVQERLMVKPYGQRNIAVISDADTMTLRAQNRLLKTLEEPPQGTIIILLSENIENLTQTILSRCVKYRINYFGSASYEYMIQRAEKIVDMLLEGEPFYRLKKEVEDIIKEQRETEALLDAMERIYRDLLINNNSKSRLYKKEQIYQNVAVIEETRRQLQRGVSKSYAIKNLIIKIGG